MAQHFKVKVCCKMSFLGSNIHFLCLMQEDIVYIANWADLHLLAASENATSFGPVVKLNTDHSLFSQI